MLYGTGMSATAHSIPPPIDATALRAALSDIPGIDEVRLVRGTVWVIVDDVDVDRDCALSGTLAETLPAEVEWHTAPRSRLHMVPDGDRLD
jgi:hypothetical protein